MTLERCIYLCICLPLEVASQRLSAFSKCCAAAAIVLVVYVLENTDHLICIHMYVCANGENYNRINSSRKKRNQPSLILHRRKTLITC